MNQPSKTPEQRDSLHYPGARSAPPRTADIASRCRAMAPGLKHTQYMFLLQKL